MYCGAFVIITIMSEEMNIIKEIVSAEKLNEDLTVRKFRIVQKEEATRSSFALNWYNH